MNVSNENLHSPCPVETTKKRKQKVIGLDYFKMNQRAEYHEDQMFFS